MIPSEDIKAKVKEGIGEYRWWCIDYPDCPGTGSQPSQETVLADVALHRAEEHGEVLEC